MKYLYTLLGGILIGWSLDSLFLKLGFVPLSQSWTWIVVGLVLGIAAFVTGIHDIQKEH